MYCHRMRRTSLLFSLVLAACGSGVSNPNTSDGDDDVVGNPDSDNPTDTQPNIPQLSAVILGDEHVVDGSGTVTLAAQAVDVANPTYAWTFGDGSSAVGQSVTHTYATKGCFAVALTVSADQAIPGNASANVYAPADFDGEVDPLPPEHGFVARVPGAVAGRLIVRGTMTSPGWRAIEVDVDGAVQTHALCASGAEPFEFEASVPATLTKHAITVSAVVGNRREELGATTDIVAGDVIIIQGQSNAESANYQGITLPQSDFVRSWGTAAVGESASIADNSWHLANGNQVQSAGSIGQWPMKMALDLIEAHQVPLAIINGSHSGMPIGWFQRDNANHANTANNYGRLLRRMRAANLDHAVRAILYFQGESDGSNATGHRDGFAAVVAAWREDYAGVEHVYETQVRPGCGDPSIDTRNFMRLFGQTSPDSHAMSATAMDAHDGCHYQYTGGYEVLGQQYARLLGRDLYGDVIADVEAIDVTTASYDATNNRIRVETRSDATGFTVEPGVAANFSVVGGTSTVSDVTMDGDTIVVQLTAGTQPTEVRYNAHQGEGATILNARGVGLLAFRLTL